VSNLTCRLLRTVGRSKTVCLCVCSFNDCSMYRVAFQQCASASVVCLARESYPRFSAGALAPVFSLDLARGQKIFGPLEFRPFSGLNQSCQSERHSKHLQ